MSEKHTPVPYHVRIDGLHVFAANGDLVAGCGGGSDNTRPNLIEQQRENAEFIVRACNSHDELLDALKALVAATKEGDNPQDMGVSSDADVVKAAEAAIAKAEGR